MMLTAVVHLFILFCPLHNDTQCRELEIAPADRALTLPACMRGAMIGDQRTFEMEGVVWQIKGGRCEEVPLPIAETQKRLREALRR